MLCSVASKDAECSCRLFARGVTSKVLEVVDNRVCKRSRRGRQQLEKDLTCIVRELPITCVQSMTEHCMHEGVEASRKGEGCAHRNRHPRDGDLALHAQVLQHGRAARRREHRLLQIPRHRLKQGSEAPPQLCSRVCIASALRIRARRRSQGLARIADRLMQQQYTAIATQNAL